jgi:transcriptional antiterminator RfaH
LAPNKTKIALKTETEKVWYALYTKSRAEKKVLEQFNNMEISAYLPLKRELRQWSDRKKWVEVPIINSYIFIQILPVDYKRVFEAHGVVAYVSKNGKAVQIPDKEIETMRKAIDNKLSFSVEESTIKKGQTVMVTGGPLKGISGEVIEIRGQKKLQLRISHIGYSIILNMDENITVQ